MAGRISAPAQAMQDSASIMRQTKDSITQVKTRVMQDVFELQYLAGSYTTFKASMDDWSADAQSIINDLDSMADRLIKSAQAVIHTEDSNRGEASSIPSGQ